MSDSLAACIRVCIESGKEDKEAWARRDDT